MNIDKLQTTLLAAARADRPSDRVPFAFEKRILARLKESHAADAWAFWGRALWRATAPCAAVMIIVLSVWTIYSANGGTTEVNLEDAVLAHVQLAYE